LVFLRVGLVVIPAKALTGVDKENLTTSFLTVFVDNRRDLNWGIWVSSIKSLTNTFKVKEHNPLALQLFFNFLASLTTDKVQNLFPKESRNKLSNHHKTIGVFNFTRDSVDFSSRVKSVEL